MNKLDELVKIDRTKIDDAKKYLNAREWNIANGNHRNGNFPPLERSLANDLFAWFCVGRSLKEISELTNYEYKWVIATAIEYDWFNRKKEGNRHQSEVMKKMAKDLANNIFMMNMHIVNQEISKVLTDPNYKSSILQIKDIRDIKELLAVTMQANEIQCALANQGKISINNNNINQNALSATEEKREALGEAIEVIEADEEKHVKALQAVEKERKK